MVGFMSTLLALLIIVALVADGAVGIFLAQAIFAFIVYLIARISLNHLLAHKMLEGADDSLAESEILREHLESTKDPAKARTPSSELNDMYDGQTLSRSDIRRRIYQVDRRLCEIKYAPTRYGWVMENSARFIGWAAFLWPPIIVIPLCVAACTALLHRKWISKAHIWVFALVVILVMGGAPWYIPTILAGGFAGYALLVHRRITNSLYVYCRNAWASWSRRARAV